jgi:hypothetical protein
MLFHNLNSTAEKSDFFIKSFMEIPQFWKGAIHGSFHQSLVAIGPVVSEEKIKM